MMITVNISDARVSQDADDTIVTYSLGSCIGVTIYDPVAHCGGMLHYQLPTSTLDADKAKAHPLMFADTGMNELLRQFQSIGGQPRRARVKIAGAAQMLNDTGVFSIGKRNHAAIRKILWQHGIMLESEDVGGTAPRNLYLRLSDGAVTIKVSGNTKEL